MRLPPPRGHTSAALVALLRSAPPDRPALLVSSGTRPVWADDDLQLALWTCYNRSFSDEHHDWDGHPALAQFRATLEARWEAALRTLGAVDAVDARPSGPVQLTEWDQHQSFWLPRGGFRAVLRDIDAYGSIMWYPSCDVSAMPVPTLALANALAFFGSHERLMDALIGFLTAVDTMAGDPYAQLAAGSADDVLFGFGVCQSLHALLRAHVAEAWGTGRSSLRARWLPLPDRINVGC